MNKSVKVPEYLNTMKECLNPVNKTPVETKSPMPIKGKRWNPLPKPRTLHIELIKCTLALKP